MCLSQSYMNLKVRWSECYMYWGEMPSMSSCSKQHRIAEFRIKTKLKPRRVVLNESHSKWAKPNQEIPKEKSYIGPTFLLLNKSVALLSMIKDIS